MSKVTKEAFLLWKETDWFRQFLKKKIAEADEEINVMTKTILVCPLNEIEGRRMLAAGIAGQASALAELLDLEHGDLTDEE